jgi:hypothetical protein
MTVRNMIAYLSINHTINNSGTVQYKSFVAVAVVADGKTNFSKEGTLRVHAQLKGITLQFVRLEFLQAQG